MSTRSGYLHSTFIKEGVSTCMCVCERVRVDRRAAAYTDGRLSVAGAGQQMPEVTPTAAFH